MDLHLFGFRSFGRLSLGRRGGRSARDQRVEHQGGDFRLAGDRVYPVWIEVGRNHIDLRHRHIAGEVVIKGLYGLLAVGVEVLAVAADLPDAGQIADGPQGLVNLVELALEILVHPQRQFMLIVAKPCPGLADIRG